MGDDESIASDLSPDTNARIHKLWDARMKYATACGKENDADYKSAVTFYRGGEGEWDGMSKDFWDGFQVSSNTWARDVNLLASYLLGNDPRVIAKSHKGKALQNTADAVAALANYAYAANGTRLEVTSAMIESLFHNKAYVFQGWNNYKNLPTWRWCAENVYLDPDALGDMKRALWIAEKFTMPLEEILNDPKVSDEVKRALKERKDIQSQTTVPKRKGPRDGGAPGDVSDSRAWNDQPGFTKLVCFRIFSRAGVLPLGSKSEDNTRLDVADPSNESVGELTPPPQPAFDAKPQVVDYARIDKDRRKFILLVQGFDKVVKIDDWHMDHFDRDDFPYVRLQLTKLPGDDDGVPVFKLLRPIFRAMNMMLSFAVADARDSARRIIGIDKNKIKSANAVETVQSGKHLEALLQEGRDAVQVYEFTARNPRGMELYPLLKQIHDESSGVNDTLRGEAGQTEKTATEAKDLADKAAAGLAMLEDAMEGFHNSISRLDVMAIQRYVPKESVYAPCPGCAPEPTDDGEGEASDERGPGFVPHAYIAPTPMAPAPTMPCPFCGPETDPGDQAPPHPDTPIGHGWDQDQVDAADPITRGADFYLSDHYVAAWRDDLSLAQVRAEIVVYVQKGSSQKGFQERRVAVLTHTIQTVGPILEKYGAFRSFFAIVKKIMDAADPDDEGLAPTDQEVAEMVLVGQQIMKIQFSPPQPEPPQVPPPPPPSQLDIQKVQNDAQAKQATNQIAASKVQGDHAIEAQKITASQQDSSAKMALELKKLALEEQRLALEASGIESTLKELQAELADTQQKHGTLVKEREKAHIAAATQAQQVAAAPANASGAPQAASQAGMAQPPVVPPGTAWPAPAAPPAAPPAPEEAEVTEAQVAAIVQREIRAAMQEMKTASAPPPTPVQAPAPQAAPMFGSLVLNGNIEGGINMPAGTKMEVTAERIDSRPDIHVHVPEQAPAEITVNVPKQDAPVVHVHPPAPPSGPKTVTIKDDDGEHTVTIGE